MDELAFRDFRVDERRRPEQYAGVAASVKSPTSVVTFGVMVRRDDGVLFRFDVDDVSRYLAAVQAAEMLKVQQQRGGTPAVVSLQWDPRQPIGVGCECQGECRFDVLLENRAGIRRCVSLWALNRETALELATARMPGGRPVLARVRYRCVGRCDYCGVVLFADNRPREVPKGMKCRDCW